jgi:PLD-like domain
MKFIANWINGSYLRKILPPSSVEVGGVLAAIAYGSNEEHFLQNCIDNKYRLDIWMRFDHTVPVKIPLLKKLLNLTSKNIFCYQIPDRLHSKVIWWQGYGAYIGSANLSDRAWSTNIEAGLFIKDLELVESGLVAELDGFFDRLRKLPQSFPLCKETIDEIERINIARSGIFKIDEISKNMRTVPEFQGLPFSSILHIQERRKEAFRNEWNEALTILRSIAKDVIKFRPAWVKENIPSAWQADQFLHAYYYNNVREGNRHPYEEFYQANKRNPGAALQETLVWWKSLKEPPTHEDQTFYESAPYIQKMLSKDRILNLTQGEFQKICKYTHATKDHITKIPLKRMGVDYQASMSIEERIKIYSKWLWEINNQRGMNVAGILNYVLYTGNSNFIWRRLFEVTNDEKYIIPHYGLNSIAEVIGWAQPEVIPPRNGRTSKALRALGYDVRVYSS